MWEAGICVLQGDAVVEARLWDKDAALGGECCWSDPWVRRRGQEQRALERHRVTGSVQSVFKSKFVRHHFM